MIRPGTSFFLAVAFAAWTLTTARAEHSITWANTQPEQTHVKKIAVSGNYSVDPGWEIAIVWLEAIPSGGGVVNLRACRVDKTGQTWSGTSTALPLGTYSIYVSMKL